MFTIFFPSLIESQAIFLLKKKYRYLISGVGVFKNMHQALKEKEDQLIILAGTAGGRKPLVRGNRIIASGISLYPNIPRRLGGVEFNNSIKNKNLLSKLDKEVKELDICSVLLPGTSPSNYFVEAMEGYGIAISGRKFIELRVISNIIGERVIIDDFIIKELASFISDVVKNI